MYIIIGINHDDNVDRFGLHIISFPDVINCSTGTLTLSIDEYNVPLSSTVYHNPKNIFICSLIG